MKHKLLILMALAAICACTAGQKDSGVRVVEDFNFDWKFSLGDSPDFEFTAEELAAYKAEQDAASASATGYHGRSVRRSRCFSSGLPSGSRPP